MRLLNGKVAVVTGGTAGIGRAIAVHFIRHGAHVIILGTNQERAEQVLQEMRASATADQQCEKVLVNLTDTETVVVVCKDLLERFGHIDVLVNNAGITRDGLLMKMTEEDWDIVQSVNLKSIFNTCRALVRSMIKARVGKIINLSSVVGLVGNAGQTNYAASKAAIIGFSKALAKELASKGIQVNCIAPGFIQTPMTDVLTEVQKEAIMHHIPLGRFGSVLHVADAALFLASSMSDYMTGQVLVVDGGMTMDA